MSTASISAASKGKYIYNAITPRIIHPTIAPIIIGLTLSTVRLPSELIARKVGVRVATPAVFFVVLVAVAAVVVPVAVVSESVIVIESENVAAAKGKSCVVVGRVNGPKVVKL